MNTLQKIQSELKAPKNQLNKFGGYNYRSCEDILEALKPLLAKHGASLTLSDSIRHMDGVAQMVVVDESTKPKKKQLVTANLCYVEAVATIMCGEESVSVTASAAIDINKAGMDYAQCFGASSSYARKYALNGLFLIDDTKDADATNSHGKEEKPAAKTIKYVDASELAAMSTLAKEVEADIPKLCEYFKIESLEHAPAEMYPQIMKALMKKKGK